MATTAVAPPPFLAGGRRGGSSLRRSLLLRRVAASAMKDEPMISKNGGKEELVTNSLNIARRASHPGLSSSLSNQVPVVPAVVHPAEPCDLRFNRLRPSIEESDCMYKRIFGRYAAREAILDEEYWIAAWLRAEDHYEDQLGNRYVESFKRKFASQVKNDNIKRTVLNSVVGTLDVCIRHPLHGEKYPMEPGKIPSPCKLYQSNKPRFGYLTNVCVAKYARRQGIASNMLFLAIDAASFNGKDMTYLRIEKPRYRSSSIDNLTSTIGAENIYVHVHKDNLPAQKLYGRVGFKMVDLEGAVQSSDLYLLSLRS